MVRGRVPDLYESKLPDADDGLRFYLLGAIQSDYILHMYTSVLTYNDILASTDFPRDPCYNYGTVLPESLSMLMFASLSKSTDLSSALSTLGLTTSLTSPPLNSCLGPSIMPLPGVFMASVILLYVAARLQYTYDLHQHLRTQVACLNSAYLIMQNIFFPLLLPLRAISPSSCLL
jgi:hypothetical protein